MSLHIGRLHILTCCRVVICSTFGALIYEEMTSDGPYVYWTCWAWTFQLHIGWRRRSWDR